MHLAKSIAIGLMVLSIVALIDAGLEAFADSGSGPERRVPTIITILDGVTPVSSVITGLLAAAILWSGPRSNSFSGDLLAVLVSFLVVIAAMTGTIATTLYFHYLNGPRPIPWYRFALSGILFIAMGWAVAQNIIEKRKAEQDVTPNA
jgi:hypothetical protein